MLKSKISWVTGAAFVVVLGLVALKATFDRVIPSCGPLNSSEMAHYFGGGSESDDCHDYESDYFCKKYLEEKDCRRWPDTSVCEESDGGVPEGCAASRMEYTDDPFKYCYGTPTNRNHKTESWSNKNCNREIACNSTSFSDTRCKNVGGILKCAETQQGWNCRECTDGVVGNWIREQDCECIDP